MSDPYKVVLKTETKSHKLPDGRMLFIKMATDIGYVVETWIGEEEEEKRMVDMNIRVREIGLFRWKWRAAGYSGYTWTRKGAIATAKEAIALVQTRKEWELILNAN